MKRAALLALSLFLTACASGHKKTSNEIRGLVLANKHAEAVELLKKSELARDKKSRFLYQVELGLLEHYKGDYAASVLALTEAKAILDELYTVKASGKLKAALGNDNEDFYYGEKYEASLVYFYLALNQYLLGDLERARAEVVDWDSMLTEMKQKRQGSALFKNDLLAKTFGAFIHEAQNNQKDDQIALQLYKDAAQVFFQNYNLYPTFNGSFEAFRKNFADLPKLPLKEVEGKYVLKTNHASSFQEFLDSKIQKLTKKVRRGEEARITFLLQDGLIVEKIAKKYKLPMNWGANASLAFSLGMGNHIKFELPIIKAVPKLELARLRALNPDGSLAAEAPLTVIAPLGDIAEEAINEHSTAIASKTAARVAAKHLTTFIAAQAAMYVGSKSDNAAVATVGLLAGTVGHAAAIAALNETEKADVRFWSTLPSNIRMGELTLKKGKYRFVAVFGEEGSTFHRTIDLGEETVGEAPVKLVMSKNFQSDTNFTLSTILPNPKLINPP